MCLDDLNTIAIRGILNIVIIDKGHSLDLISISCRAQSIVWQLTMA